MYYIDEVRKGSITLANGDKEPVNTYHLLYKTPKPTKAMEYWHNKVYRAGNYTLEYSDDDTVAAIASLTIK